MCREPLCAKVESFIPIFIDLAIDSAIVFVKSESFIPIFIDLAIDSAIVLRSV
jgi:hypothetical protein